MAACARDLLPLRRAEIPKLNRRQNHLAAYLQLRGLARGAQVGRDFDALLVSGQGILGARGHGQHGLLRPAHKPL